MTTTLNAVTSTGLVQTSDGSGVIKVQSNGVTTNALAWVNFTGSSATINANYNVSSVTRNSIGNYTINFTNAMTNANYAWAISYALPSPSANNNASSAIANNGNTTSSLNILMQRQTASSGTTFDTDYVVTCSIFGN